MFLDDNEIKKLTGKRSLAAIIRALDAMRIYYELNPAGDIVISRAYIERRFGIEAANDSAAMNAGPRFEAIQ